MAKWNSITPSIWNAMGTVTATTGVPLNDVLKVNWADFSNSPYILSRQKPSMPVLTCSSVCMNSSGNIFSASGTGSTYIWTAPAGTTITSGQNTNSVIIDWGATAGPVTVAALSTLGCASNPASCSDLEVNELLNIPNIFTPDGDGINDLFFINNTPCIKAYHLEIFNRWGMKVFETFLAGSGWDGYTASGVTCQNGTYYYILKTTSLTGKDVSANGFISLLRTK